MIGSMLCLVALVAAALCTWRFGPWYDESTNTQGTPDLKALNTCDGCCNGLKSNCDLPVSDVTFAMVHNAQSSRANLFAAYNNLKPLEEALIAGYRGLMLDSCICDGSIGEKITNYFNGEGNTGENYLGFCHTSCDAGVRSPVKVLENIKTFLDVNTNEVLILEFEIIDNSLPELFAAIDDSGLDEYIYHSTSTDVEWPTMQSLIDANTRLLLFAHGDGIDSSCTEIDCPEGIYYTFDHFQQTNWNDDTCDVKGNEREGIGFFLMNHWKNNDADLPSQSNAEEFNTYNALMDRVKKCGDRIPNIIAVDFWDVGDVLPFVAEVNEKNVE